MTGKMRIGLVLDVYQGYTSGVTTYVSLLRRYFEQNNAEVFIFCFGKVTSKPPQNHIVVSPGVRIFGSYYIGSKFSRHARDLLKSMDVLHLQHPFISGPLALHTVRPGKCPVLFTNHTRYDLYMQVYIPFLPRKLSQIFLKKRLVSFLRGVDAVIAPSSGMVKMLHHFGVESNLFQIPNGIDLDAFSQVNQRRWSSPRIMGGEKSCTLIYVGRLVKEKNLLLLLRVFRKILNQVPAAQLVLVGDGPYRIWIEQFVRMNQMDRRVTITGFVPYDQVPTYLSSADIFITASVSEVHPLTIIEAMAAGLPVIAIRSTGIEDCVIHDETGLLDDQEGARLVELALDLIGNAEKREWMGKKGAERARQFSLQTSGNALMTLYRELIQQKSRMIE